MAIQNTLKGLIHLLVLKHPSVKLTEGYTDELSFELAKMFNEAIDVCANNVIKTMVQKGKLIEAEPDSDKRQ